VQSDADDPAPILTDLTDALSRQGVKKLMLLNPPPAATS